MRKPVPTTKVQISCKSAGQFRAFVVCLPMMTLMMAFTMTFYAHLSQRLIGELIGYSWSGQRLIGELIGYSWSGVRPLSVGVVNNFKHLLLQNHLPDHSQILCGTSLGRGNESLFAASESHDQDGRHAHIW